MVVLKVIYITCEVGIKGIDEKPFSNKDNNSIIVINERLIIVNFKVVIKINEVMEGKMEAYIL